MDMHRSLLAKLLFGFTPTALHSIAQGRCCTQRTLGHYKINREPKPQRGFTTPLGDRQLDLARTDCFELYGDSIWPRHIDFCKIADSKICCCVVLAYPIDLDL